MKKYFIGFLPLLLIVMGSMLLPITGLKAQDDIIDKFEKKLWTLNGGGALDYYTFTPESEKPTEGYPLIVALHGTSELVDFTGEGAHITRRELVKGWVTDEVQGAYAPFVLAPQASSDHIWYDASVQAAIGGIIESLIADDTVDPNRIYLVGHSLGGFGAWLLPISLRNLTNVKFAAMAPMSGFWSGSFSDLSLNQAAQEVYGEIPIWAFSHVSDLDGSDSNTRGIVNTLESNGLQFVRNSRPTAGNAEDNNRHIYTEYTQSTMPCSGVTCHRVCDEAILDPNFYDWLFNQDLSDIPDNPDDPSEDEFYLLKNKDSANGWFRPLNSGEQQEIYEVQNYSSQNLDQWEEIDLDNGFVQLRNVGADKYLTAGSSWNGVFVGSPNGDYSVWEKETLSDGYFYLNNKANGNRLRFCFCWWQYKLEQNSATRTDNDTHFKLEPVSSSSSRLATANPAIGNLKESQLKGLQLFPMPVNNTLNIAGLVADTKLVVMDTFGRQIMVISEDGPVDVSNMRPGIYLVGMQSDGRLLKQEKMLIQR